MGNEQPNHGRKIVVKNSEVYKISDELKRHLGKIVEEFDEIETLMENVPHHGGLVHSAFPISDAVKEVYEMRDGITHEEGKRVNSVYTHTDGKQYKIEIKRVLDEFENDRINKNHITN